MLDDYTVNIIYKNRSLEDVSQRNYLFADYCQDQKLNLMHVITEVENAFYSMQNDKSKDEWSQDALDSFQRIRHKLLDVANGIVRLPQTLQYKGVNIGSIGGAEYIASIVNKYTQK